MTRIWFCPLDPIFRPEVGYGGSPQYMRLFSPKARWSEAAQHVDVFKIYPQWISQASDSELRNQFADLRRRHIALGLEFGVLSESSTCGKGVEGFGGKALLPAARRIHANGGQLRFLAMDEPVYFSTVYSGRNACRWSLDRMAENAAANIQMLHSEFPEVVVGQIEPVPICYRGWVDHYAAGILAFRRALGFAPAFFHADVSWIAPRVLRDLQAFKAMVIENGPRFGVIYNGTPADRSDASWIRSAVRHMEEIELGLGSAPDDVIFQSWDRYPRLLLPETRADSLTGLVDRYCRQRTSLRGSDTGGTLSGTLTSTAGHGISRARISLWRIPYSGTGVWGHYSFRATVPPGVGSIVFGARINLECCCHGHAHLSISSFKLKPKLGSAIERRFTNRERWSITITGSPSPIAQIVRGQFRATVLPDQTVMLNSAPISLRKKGGYEFTVRAQVAPRSAGSGYLTMIFLDRSNVEMSRVEIPLQGASIPLGVTTTNALGRWRFRASTKVRRSMTMQIEYLGSQKYWPTRLAFIRKGIRMPRHWFGEERTIAERVDYTSVDAF